MFWGFWVPYSSLGTIQETLVSDLTQRALLGDLDSISGPVCAMGHLQIPTNLICFQPRFLFGRSTRFFDRRTPQGRRCFWEVWWTLGTDKSIGRDVCGLNTRQDLPGLFICEFPPW